MLIIIEPCHVKTRFLPMENKGADQLRSNCEADRRLCFRYMDSTVPLLPKFFLAIFCDCTGRFVLEVVGNPEDRFSRIVAQL